MSSKLPQTRRLPTQMRRADGEASGRASPRRAPDGAGPRRQTRSEDKQARIKKKLTAFGKMEPLKILPGLITSPEISQMIAIEVVALANETGSTGCQFDKVLLESGQQRLELPDATER